jgi:chloramphenicol O-acetyltransferase type A
MRKIDMQTWPRREHFKLFSAFNHPHAGFCANVDVTAFYPAVKQRGISFTVATTYAIARAANAVPEFRYRIRGEEVVEHEIVHPSITFLTGEDLFSFATFEYIEDFSLFAARAAEQIAHVQDHRTLEDEPGRDDLLFMTPIPWLSFTGVMHPMQLHPGDSVPRIAWGKFFEEGKLVKMPLAVQGHHALMDGIHMGRFYAEVQDYLHHPGSVLSEA